MENNHNLREILSLELQRRAAKNKAYSLRAFAKQLGISPSYLCEILQERKNPTRQMTEKILEKLKRKADRELKEVSGALKIF